MAEEKYTLNKALNKILGWFCRVAWLLYYQELKTEDLAIPGPSGISIWCPPREDAEESSSEE